MSANTKDKAGTSTITTPTDREIVIERVFDAPRDRVYTAFTDPALIPQWWGRYEDTTTVDKMEVNAGGTTGSSPPIRMATSRRSGARSGR